MSRRCVKCRAPPHGEYRIGGEWVPACSEACARAAVPERDVRARIGRALDTALIGPEQTEIDDDAFAGIPDELVVEILHQYPPSSLLRIAGASTRLRAIVLDPRVISELVNGSFERKGRADVEEWLSLARRAANTGQTALVEAVVEALDVRETRRGDVTGEGYSARRWQMTRFGLALRTHDVGFAEQMMAGIDPADAAGFVPHALRLGLRDKNSATLRTLLAVLRRADVLLRFTFGTQLKRDTLFADVGMFRMLLESGSWSVEREDVEDNATMLSFAPGYGVLGDAIRKRRADIVQLLIDDGRSRLVPSLFSISTSDEIVAILLRSRAINPFGAQSLAELRMLQQRYKDGAATRLMDGADFEW